MVEPEYDMEMNIESALENLPPMTFRRVPPEITTPFPWGFFHLQDTSELAAPLCLRERTPSDPSIEIPVFGEG